MRYFLAVTLIILVCTGCERQAAIPAKPIVLVSVPPYLYFAKRIAGDTVTLLTLVPPGTNPHIYEPTPKQVQAFRKAALWIRLGEPAEQKIYQVLKEQCPQMQIADVTQGVPLLALCDHCDQDAHPVHTEEGKDLHIWLSPKWAQTQAQTIAQHLSALLPEHRERYQHALQLLLDDLKTVEQEIHARLAARKGHAIVVSHPAFAYFCQDYGLKQLSIESEGKDPLPQQIASLLKRAKEEQIALVIAEPQYSDKGALRIAECLHVPLHTIDPYAEAYLDNVKHIAEVLGK